MNQFKHYKMKCEDCGHSFEKAYWKIDGVWKDVPSCIECSSENVLESHSNATSDFPMINSRFNLEKNLPGKSKEFFKEFKQRHSKYGITVKDY